MNENIDKKYLEKLNKAKSDKATPYAMSKNYSIDEFIIHKEFGIGLVIEKLGEGKIRIFFSDKRRILLQNFTKEWA